MDIKLHRRHADAFVACLFVVIAAITGCVSVAGKPVDAPPTQRPDATPQIVMSGKVEIHESGFFKSVVRDGTHWKYFGTLPQGDVYRPLDTVFTVESGNVQEAYMVIKDRHLVGCYLPVEHNYFQLESAIAVNFN